MRAIFSATILTVGLLLQTWPTSAAFFDPDALANVDLSKLPDRAVDVAGQKIVYKTFGDVLLSPDEVQSKAMSGLLWPHGKFVFAFDASVDPSQQKLFVAACHLWEQGTPIVCTQRTSERGYIIVKAVGADGVTAGRSVVGFHSTPQAMEIAQWDQKTLVHEIGHALGKAHEHQRSDAAKFLEIHMEHGVPAADGNLMPIASTRNLGVPMDFKSVMFYWRNAFSKDGQDVIVLKPPYDQFESTIGQSDTPSDNDLLDIKKSYSP
jgi:hypothetical protein